MENVFIYTWFQRISCVDSNVSFTLHIKTPLSFYPAFSLTLNVELVRRLHRNNFSTFFRIFIVVQYEHAFAPFRLQSFVQIILAVILSSLVNVLHEFWWMNLFLSIENKLHRPQRRIKNIHCYSELLINCGLVWIVLSVWAENPSVVVATDPNIDILGPAHCEIYLKQRNVAVNSIS